MGYRVSLALSILLLLISAFFYYFAFSLDEEVNSYSEVEGVLKGFKCEKRGTQRLLLYYLKDVNGSYGIDIRNANYGCPEYNAEYSNYLDKNIKLLTRGKWAYQVSIDSKTVLPLMEVVGELKSSSLNRANFLMFISVLMLVIYAVRHSRNNQE